jgi:hypothetical protein
MVPPSHASLETLQEIRRNTQSQRRAPEDGAGAYPWHRLHHRRRIPFSPSLFLPIWCFFVEGVASQVDGSRRPMILHIYACSGWRNGMAEDRAKPRMLAAPILPRRGICCELGDKPDRWAPRHGYLSRAKGSRARAHQIASRGSTRFRNLRGLLSSTRARLFRWEGKRWRAGPTWKCPKRKRKGRCVEWAGAWWAEWPAQESPLLGRLEWNRPAQCLIFFFLYFLFSVFFSFYFFQFPIWTSKYEYETSTQFEVQVWLWICTQIRFLIIPVWLSLCIYKLCFIFYFIPFFLFFSSNTILIIIFI